MTMQQARDRAARKHARIVEHIYVKGRCYLNVVLPDGRPETWKVKL
jgi:hypothetical protein